MKDNIIKDFNLPKYIKGKSFAEASRAINKKFDGRNDNISTATKNELLERLANAQEYIKEVESINQPTQDKMTGGYPNQYFLGGLFGENSNQANTNPEIDSNISQNTTENLAIGKSKGAGIGGALEMVTTGLDFANTAFGDTGIDENSAMNIDPTKIKRGGGVATGAIKGAKAGMALGPIGAAVGGVVGGIANFIGASRKRKDANKARANYDFSLHNEATKDYALGGEIEDPINRELIDNTFKNLPISNNASLNSLDKIDPVESSTRTTDSKLGQSLNKIGNYLKENSGDMLRYAPVAMNAFQLSKLNSPEVESLQRLNNRYRRDPFDINTLTNKIENQYSGLNNRLASASGGSSAALRANLLGAQIGKTQALSDAYSKAEQINRNDKLREQDFNLNIDKFNVGQSNLEQDINAKNRAAYHNEKSKLLSAIGTDLGNIGKEQVTKKQAKEIFGYDWKGKYKKQNPKASKKEINEKYKEALINKFSSLDLNNSSYGGYLKKK